MLDPALILICLLPYQSSIISKSLSLVHFSNLHSSFLGLSNIFKLDPVLFCRLACNTGLVCPESILNCQMLNFFRQAFQDKCFNNQGLVYMDAILELIKIPFKYDIDLKCMNAMELALNLAEQIIASSPTELFTVMLDRSDLCELILKLCTHQTVEISSKACSIIIQCGCRYPNITPILDRQAFVDCFELHLLNNDDMLSIVRANVRCLLPAPAESILNRAVDVLVKQFLNTVAAALYYDQPSLSTKSICMFRIRKNLQDIKSVLADLFETDFGQHCWQVHVERSLACAILTWTMFERLSERSPAVLCFHRELLSEISAFLSSIVKGA
ncbi:hypothetical protein GJ496_005672, partial [Pomphorhynchus laevis]